MGEIQAEGYAIFKKNGDRFDVLRHTVRYGFEWICGPGTLAERLKDAQIFLVPELCNQMQRNAWWVSEAEFAIMVGHDQNGAVAAVDEKQIPFQQMCQGFAVGAEILQNR